MGRWSSLKKKAWWMIVPSVESRLSGHQDPDTDQPVLILLFFHCPLALNYYSSFLTSLPGMVIGLTAIDSIWEDWLIFNSIINLLKCHVHMQQHAISIFFLQIPHNMLGLISISKQFSILKYWWDTLFIITNTAIVNTYTDVDIRFQIK